MVLVGAAVLSTFEGPNEQANCEKAKEIFSDGIANTAAQLNVDLPEKLREEAFGGKILTHSASALPTHHSRPPTQSL